MRGDGESDVKGTYDVLVVTTRRRPWIDSAELKELVERSFDQAFADLGVRVDRLGVASDRVEARITITGDVKRTAKGFVSMAKREAVRRIREGLSDDVPSWFLSRGLFANEVMMRTVGTGLAHANVDAFLDSIAPASEGVRRRIEYGVVDLDDED